MLVAWRWCDSGSGACYRVVGWNTEGCACAVLVAAVLLDNLFGILSIISVLFIMMIEVTMMMIFKNSDNASVGDAYDNGNG
jgi:hypothetical protein